LKLYHYTSRMHLPRILAARFLEVTESNLDWHRQHAGPDVVWLTNQADLYTRDAPWAGRGQIGVDKLEIRFTVDVPDAVPWERWQRQHKMKRQWYVAFVRAGGDSSTWFVVEHRIPREQWREVRVMSEGLLLDVDRYDAFAQRIAVSSVDSSR
jgi:hypothetical protein